MIRKYPVLVLLIAVLACAGSTGNPPSKSGGSHEPRKSVVVRFGGLSVVPKVARVQAGGHVSWVNESSGGGVLLFPDSIREGLTCDSMRPNLMKVAAGYQSRPVTPGLEISALPCPLKPGTYPYKVNLYGGAIDNDAFGSMDNPRVQLEGSIQVE
ncbi:hypothetical protein MK489_03240 [Myxococcota bacterium]|nr:hypothetical protein [Myxococcota bacterium]